MIAARRGSIVIISSVNGLRAQIGLSAYNVTKAALVMLARTMALELARYGVRVNAITPGDIATAVIENVADQSEAQATIPLGRYGRAEEVAEMALFLASARAGYTTGSVMGVDGGLDAQLYPGDIFAEADAADDAALAAAEGGPA
jgi:NAD(P)-dependent dehydrogenase (short-subunit alcohol dehydrogenase family)